MSEIRRGVAIIVVLGILGGFCSCRRAQEAPPLLCYVGGTMRPVMEELAMTYEKMTGQPIQIDYADSGSLMVKIEQTRMGDLYVAHDPFQEGLMRKGLGNRVWTTAALTPVVVVPKGNPKSIRGFRDLAQPGLRVILSHPIYSTAGHIVTRMAEKAGLIKALESNIVSRTRGGGEAANAVGLGTADAAVVWNAVAKVREDKLDAIPLEPDIRLIRDVDAITTATYGVIEMDYVRVGIATLVFSKHMKVATAFAGFVASPQNRAVWKRYGFSPVDPSREPEDGLAGPGRKQEEITVLCSAGMRLPVEHMARAFEQQSGVRVVLAFDGANRLLGQIKLMRKGDLYVAGDADYVDMAAQEGLVASRAVISYFVPVILVPKGNPKKITSLADLTREGIRIGQGDERAAAVGRLMPRLLQLNGVDAAAWKRNVVMNTPTVNELGMGIQLGTLDAVVVWDAIATAYAEVGEVIPIPPDKNVCPAVETAVLTVAQHPDAAGAFMAFMVSEAGRSILRENGYTVEEP